MKLADGNGFPDTGTITRVTDPTPKQIRIIKSCGTLNGRKDAVLKNLDHFEAQLGRLVKMARDLRAEVLSLTTE